MFWFLYIIRTINQHLYTGITTDLSRRFEQHKTGSGAKYLRGKGPLVMVFSIEVGNQSDALMLERWVKQLSKANKERLVLAQPSLTELLSQRRSKG